MERLKTNVLGPDGPRDAKILLVGQAPGEEEDRKLRPFVGPSGRLLDRCLKMVGMARSEVLVNNVFFQRPPKNDVGYFFQDKKCTKPTWEGEEHISRLRDWLQDLLKERESTGVGPNVIGALGREAMMILTGKVRITKWRGSVLPCTLVEGFKVYPTYHPSFVNRLMNEKREALQGEKKRQSENVLPVFLKDLNRIVEQSYFPEIHYPKRDFVICRTTEQALGELNKLHQASQIAIDIETLRGEDGPILWCIGFSPSPDFAFVIPFVKNMRPHWTLNEEASVVKKISEVFLDPNSQKIFQNGSYDLSILGRYYGLRLAEGTYQDTMLCHHASYPYLRKGLDLLASIYTWEPYYKDDGKVWDGRRISDDAEFTYNARDCCVTREIFPVVERDAKELHTLSGYQRTIDCFPSVLYMQIRGVKIDVEKKEELAVLFEEKVKMAESKVNLLAEGEINLASSQQVAMLLYTKLNLPIQYNHKTKRPSADKDAVNMLLQKTKQGSREHEILEAISEHRKFSKLLNTYTSMEVDSDGRIHTSYGWISTYRLSSSESHFGGGGNLQNIPVRSDEGREIRRLFIPDDGLEFVASDLEQAEAREVAWLARDTRLIELFLTPGYDVHWLRAKAIFGIPQSVPYNPVAKFRCRYLDTEQTLYFYRRIGKTVVHAFNYRMGPRMLQAILIREGAYLDERTCRTLLEQTKRDNPLTVRWQEQTIEEVKQSRTLVTPLGRRREFRGRLNDQLYRSAIAFRPQSTVGELLQIAIKNIAVKSTYYEHLLNVHDEVVGQGKPEHRKEILKTLKEEMEITHEVGGRDLTIPCSFKVGPNWGDLKEIDFAEETKAG